MMSRSSRYNPYRSNTHRRNTRCPLSGLRPAGNPRAAPPNVNPAPAAAENPAGRPPFGPRGGGGPADDRRARVAVETSGHVDEPVGREHDVVVEGADRLAAALQ